MPNAKEAAQDEQKFICLVGPSGSGKTTQVRTLPGRKLALLFDRNALASLRGADVDYEQFLPKVAETNSEIRKPKEFDQKTKSKKSTTFNRQIAPTLYSDFRRWITDTNRQKEIKEKYDWIIVDSLTFLQEAIYAATMYNFRRVRGEEEIQDYKTVGATIAGIFQDILSIGCNVLTTCHLNTYKDEDTKKVTTELKIAGDGRILIPAQATDVLLCITMPVANTVKYQFRCVPDPTGLRAIRTSLTNEAFIDANVDFQNPERSGLGLLLSKQGETK